MARKNAAQKAAKQKAAKQKKVLIVLGVLLLGSLGYAVMTLSHLSTPVSAAASPTATPAPDGSTPTPTKTEVAAVVTPGIAAPPAGSLRAFTAFGRKDPFDDNGPNLSGGSSTSTSSSSASTSKKSTIADQTGGASASKPKQPSGRPTSAVFSINGKRTVLKIGAKFGHPSASSDAALFKLVALSARTKTAVIVVIGTQQQYTLNIREPLTLAQTGGGKYTLILESVGSAHLGTIFDQSTH